MAGHYSLAVAECRRAIESIRSTLKLKTDMDQALGRLADPDRRKLGKDTRKYVIGESIRFFTHLAHHAGEGGEPDIFSREDAVLAVASTGAWLADLAHQVSVDTKSVEGTA
jgi:hypothetical protein